MRESVHYVLCVVTATAVVIVVCCVALSMCGQVLLYTVATSQWFRCQPVIQKILVQFPNEAICCYFLEQGILLTLLQLTQLY